MGPLGQTNTVFWVVSFKNSIPIQIHVVNSLSQDSLANKKYHVLYCIVGENWRLLKCLNIDISPINDNKDRKSFKDIIEGFKKIIDTL